MRLTVTILVCSVAGLLALGMVMLYSTSMAQVGAQYLVKQLLWFAIGLVPCLIAATLDYRKLRLLAWPIYALAFTLLVLVLVPGIGLFVNGARRWLPLGPLTFQPSELAKFSLLLVLAWYGERFQRQMPSFYRGLVVPALFIGAVLALIFPEPDRGTTILIAAVSGVVLIIAGVRWAYFVPPVLAGVLALAISHWNDPVRSRRIFGWLYLEEHKSGVGYQAYQAMLALGSGGLTGLGLGEGRQKLGFVPFHHTDFIFSIIGEELGFLATALVVVAYIAIVLCGVYIASRAPDQFGVLLGSGITFMIGLQAFINIGVVTSALPNKGISLPFISYGGSSLMMMLISVGVLLSIARQARAPEAFTSERAVDEPSVADNPFKVAPEASRA